MYSCEKLGHEKKDCFLLIGYPEWWGTGRGGGKTTGCGRGGRSGNIGNYGRGGTRRGITAVANAAQATESNSKIKADINAWTRLSNDQWSVLFQKRVKILRSDNGKEFACLRTFYAKQKIVHQTICVDTPQQNGRVERKHRHILNVARALCFQANLPISFWGEYVLTAVYLINHTPTPILDGKTPYESHEKDKFSSRSRRCIFVGYPSGKKGWRVYDLETGDFFVSRDIIFDERVFPYVGLVFDSEPSTPLDFSGASPTNDHIMQHDHAASIHSRGSFDIEPNINEEMRVDVTSPSPIHEENMNTSSTIVGTETPHTTITTVGKALGRGHREHKVSTRLKDYVCYTTQYHTTMCIDTPTQSSSPTHSQSSGMPYPIANYVTCNNFSSRHKSFLVAVAADYSLFSCIKNGLTLHVLVYVDDLIIAGDDSSAIAYFKQYLHRCFYMKDLGPLKYFLGIEVARNAFRQVVVLLSYARRAKQQMKQNSLTNQCFALCHILQLHKLKHKMSNSQSAPLHVDNESGYHGENNNVAPGNEVPPADPFEILVVDPIDANSHVAIDSNLPTDPENYVHGLIGGDSSVTEPKPSTKQS
ncbi:uncharacterized protein [Nicotiana tomentosiformis]|uniref:uncharacterized protein n=1 Tax=Nicotiana tomentosiformis TaxID=4098 RepID=UPI00388CB566